MKNFALACSIVLGGGFLNSAAAQCTATCGVITVSKSTSCDTIAKGINSAQGGQTVKVLLGTYMENISVTKSIKVIGEVSKNDKGEILRRPVISSRSEVVVRLKGTNIALEGFEITNGTFVKMSDEEMKKDREDREGRTGILIEPQSSQISIADNKITTIGYKYQTEWEGEQAHGINIWNYRTNDKITDITIIGNELSDLHLGRSEAITINGSVYGFKVADNVIHDVDNIAIDVGGFQEECGGKPCNEQAQNGKIIGNKVWNLTKGNPGQSGVYPSIAAIYVDGGKQVLIDGNEVHDFGVGIDFGSERGGAIEKIVVSNNLVYKNLSAGVWIGNDDLKSKVSDSYLLNNTIVNNNTEKHFEGAVRLTDTDGVQNLIVSNNIIYTDNDYPLVSNLHNKGGKIIFQSNLFYSQSKKNFSNPTMPFDTFLGKFGKEAGIFEKLTFGDRYNPVKDSPAIDKGSDKYLLVICRPAENCFDFISGRRVANEKIDVGAIELQTAK